MIRLIVIGLVVSSFYPSRRRLSLRRRATWYSGARHTP